MGVVQKWVVLIPIRANWSRNLVRTCFYCVNKKYWVVLGDQNLSEPDFHETHGALSLLSRADAITGSSQETLPVWAQLLD
jgi:hypothetical protein